MYKTAYRLTILVILLALVASLGGLLFNGLYHDNIYMSSGWKGADLVTLVIALPLLIVSLILSMRGSQRAQLVWLGMLDYMLYNYTFYLFGAAFNPFFLVYVAIFALSFFGLIFGLNSLDVEAIGWKFKNSVPVKWISGYMLLIALGLFIVYLVPIFQFLTEGVVPAIIIMSGHPTSVIFALDLAFLLPSIVLGAIWLWQRRDWGFILAGILLSKGAVYPLALAMGSYLASDAGIPGVTSLIAFWIALSVSAIIVCLYLLGNMSARNGKNVEQQNPGRISSVKVP